MEKTEKLLKSRLCLTFDELMAYIGEDMNKIASNLCKVSISFDVYNEILALIGVKSAEEFANITDEEIKTRLHAVNMSLVNHMQVIEQNKSLQSTILELKRSSNE